MKTALASHLSLAKAVTTELTRRKIESPPIGALGSLFETLFYASMRTEEGQRVTAHVVYLDPRQPDPKPPETIREDRWRYFHFAKPIPLTVPNLVKLAEASDPRTSSFAVYHEKSGSLVIWGMVDQGNSYHELVNFETDGGFSRPGIFQSSILDLGHIAVYWELEKIAELKLDSLVKTSTNVLATGPIHHKLDHGIQELVLSDRNLVGKGEKIEPFLPYLNRKCLETLCRILLRVQNFRHGGAILISSDTTELNLKYKMNYDRLSGTLRSLCAATVNQSEADERIQGLLTKRAANIPTSSYLDESIASGQLSDCEKALSSAVWFTSLLTRVDGLVLMSPQLEVKSFGVEITTEERPQEVYVSRTPNPGRLRAVDYNHYGTRHRSMMRYCAKFPKSVGFVVSQDGDVRAITKVQNKLIIWENVKLQLHDWLESGGECTCRRCAMTAKGD